MVPSQAEALWLHSQTATVSKDEEHSSSGEHIPPKDAIFVFGSQTGTAENYARCIGRLLQEQCALDIHVTDLEFELEQLLNLSSQRSVAGNPVLLMLVTSIYGDGEPTDNTLDFLTAVKTAFEEDNQAALKGLNYSIFGLDNSSYEMSNKQANDYDE